MNNREQLEKWVNGNPIHNPDSGECVPDFSCCRGIEHIAPKEIRIDFKQAHISGDEEKKAKYLGMFLGDAIAAMTDEKVYVAGANHDPAQ